MTETLSFVRSWILSLENEPTQVNEIAYSYGLNDYVQASDYLNLLKDFWQHETPYFKDAVKLGLTIIFKQPSKTPEILRHLKEGITYQRYDFQYNYIRQFTFLDIIERADYSERERIIVDQVFLAIAPNLLKWEFTEPEGKGEGKMVIHRFVLRKTKALLNIRRIILEKVTKLYIGNEDKVLEIIRQYFWTSRVFDSTIFAEEEIVIGDFLMKNFKPEIYSHCEIIHDYVETLVEYGITPKYDWMPFLTSETMNLAKIFNPKLDQEGLKFEEREARQRERVADFVRGKNLVFIEATLSRLDSIYSSAVQNKETYWIDSSLTYLFQFLASEDSTLYYGALELLMRRKYSFELPYGNIIFRPIREKWIAPKDVYERLNRYEFKQKQFWKQMVFDALEPEDINQYFLLEFIGFLFSVTDRFCFWDTDKYLKFDSQFKLSKHLLPSSASGHQNILTFITEILIEKAKQYDISFDHHVCETCYTYFIDHVHLLKRVYFLNHKRGSYYDHEGKEMAAISLLDSNILIEYLNLIPVESPLDFKFDNVSLAFVWQIPDCERLVNEAIELILEKVPYLGGFEYEANQLFKNLKPDVITEKVYPYISRFIITHSSSELHLDMIMNVILHTFESETLCFIKEILLANKDVEFAKGIRFEKGGLYSGSRVPRLEASINFYKSLIALVQSFPNPLDYAGHIGHWNEEIQWNENAKITEMKNDFKGWYD